MADITIKGDTIKEISKKRIQVINKEVLNFLKSKGYDTEEFKVLKEQLNFEGKEVFNVIKNEKLISNKSKKFILRFNLYMQLKNKD